MRIRNRKGFTIIELVVVMAIVGILVSLAVPRFSGYKKEAKVTNIINDTKVMEGTTDLYQLSHERFPEGTPYEKSELEAKIGENRVYTYEGLFTGLLEGDNFRKLDSKMIKTKLEGEFILNESTGGVFYIEDTSGTTVVETPSGYTNNLLSFDFDNINRRFVATFQNDIDMTEMNFSKGSSNSQMPLMDLGEYINPSNPKELFLDYNDSFNNYFGGLHVGDFFIEWENNGETEKIKKYFYAVDNEIMKSWEFDTTNSFSIDESNQTLTISTGFPFEEVYGGAFTGSDGWITVDFDVSNYANRTLETSYNSGVYTFVLDISHIPSGNYNLKFLIQSEYGGEFDLLPLETFNKEVTFNNTGSNESEPTPTGDFSQILYADVKSEHGFILIEVDNIGGIEEIAYITNADERIVVNLDYGWEYDSDWNIYWGELPFINDIKTIEIVSSSVGTVTENISGEVAPTGDFSQINYIETYDNELFQLYVDNIGGIQEIAYITNTSQRVVVTLDYGWEDWGDFYGEFFINPLIGETIERIEIVGENATDSFSVVRMANIDWVWFGEVPNETEGTLDYTTFYLYMENTIYTPTDVVMVDYTINNGEFISANGSWNGSEYSFTINNELLVGEKLRVYLYDNNNNQIGYRSLER